MLFRSGAGRLLVPDCLKSAIPEMLTGKVAVISRGPWPSGHKADALEILFDDGSDQPFSVQLSVGQCSQMLPDTDIGTDYPFTIWTRHGKAGSMTGKYRRADTLPCLKPWSECKSNTTHAITDNVKRSMCNSNYAELVQPFVLHFAKQMLVQGDPNVSWKCIELESGGMISVPETSESFVAKDGYGRQHILSPEALGIASCMFAYCEIAGIMEHVNPNMCEEFGMQYRHLRVHMANHPECRSIWALTD